MIMEDNHFGASSSTGVLVRDILEWHVPEEVLAVLLKDRSTGRNIERVKEAS